MVCVCIHRYGLIYTTIQYSAIRATNTKIGKKLPWDIVKEDTNFGGPAARAKKVHYSICLSLRLI